jgi:acetyl coenzyme A synthetase (ADP forming)-like protein
VSTFVAHVAESNGPMLEVFDRAGYRERRDSDHGGVRVELEIEPTERTRAAMEEREHRAESTSVARLLAPRSVAVVGAGRDPHGVGHQVLRNLLDGEFDGPVYPVHPTADHIASVRAFPDIGSIPGPVDLVIVAVPAEAVLDVVGAAADKGAVGAVVLTAGFGEVGEAAAEADLRAVARQRGLRLVGPNCIGVVNTAVNLNATFSPAAPVRGRIAMLSQSGALGIVLLERSARMGLGISSFVSVGNKADLSGNDLLQYWEDDPDTDVVLLYLESFGNPRKFARIARRVSRRKPMVAVKSGRSSAGARAASSHTAAMASPDVAVDALFLQAGVIRVDTLDELFDLAQLFGAGARPAGPGVAILGNSGGPGILAADACTAAGLAVPRLSDETQAALRAVVDPKAAVTNPVDLVASATAAVYEQALGIVLADPSVDDVIVISTPTFAAPSADVADAVCRVAASNDKTVVGCFLAAPQLAPTRRAGPEERGVPIFGTPEPAVRALARAVAHAEWCRRPTGVLRALDGFDAVGARAVVEGHLGAEPEGGWLPATAVRAVLDAAGIRTVPTEAVGDADEAAGAARRVGFPVALKAAGPDLVHKSDVGGVQLGLASEDEVRDRYAEMARALGGRMSGAVVQPMADPGVEMIVGVVHDPSFGPLVMLGMGGVATELLADRSFRILPVTDLDAAELVRSLRTSPLLFGHRGSSPVAVDALEDAVQRVARLAGIVPEIVELDLNPLTVSPSGAVAVDARIRVAPVAPGPPADLRRMR